MLRPIVPATASTNSQDARCLSCLLSLSVFIIIEASGFPQTLQSSSDVTTESPQRSPNQTSMKLPYSYLMPKPHACLSKVCWEFVKSL
jgi:hypothetical protein